MNKTLSVPEIGRVYLQRLENIKESLAKMIPKDRARRRTEILSEVCRVQFINTGIRYTKTEVSDLKSKVGKYLSEQKKIRAEAKNKEAQEKIRPFKVTHIRIIEAINICRHDRRDHLLPPEPED